MIHTAHPLINTPVLVHYQRICAKNYAGQRVEQKETMLVFNEKQARGLIDRWNIQGKGTGYSYTLLNLTHYSGNTKDIQWTESGAGHLYVVLKNQPL